MAPERPIQVEQAAILETLPPLRIPTPEVRYFDIDAVIVLPHQIRNAKHSRMSELDASIEKVGINNPPDIPTVKAEVFQEYLDFQNRMHRTGYRVDQFKEFERNGMYSFACAGHHRTKGAKARAERYRQSVGGHAYVEMPGKEHLNVTLEEILYLQYSENIHQGIKTEREAQFLYELYAWGIDNGKWVDAKDFRKQQDKKIDKKTMDQILAFDMLSIEVRDDTFEGKIPFRAGIMLGQMVPLIAQDFRHQTNVPFGPATEEVSKVINDAVAVKLSEESIHIQNGRGMRNNAPAARAYLKSICARMIKDVGTTVAVSEDVGFEELGDMSELGSFAMAGIEEQAKRELRRRQLELANVIKAVAQEPHLAAAEVVVRHGAQIVKLKTPICEDILKANDTLRYDLEAQQRREAEALEQSLFDELENELAIAS